VIPAELRDRKQWVVWRLELRADKNTKVPYQTNGRAASTTDPSTWATYAEAVEAAARFDGVGYVFHELDPFTGIDLDDCLKDGQLHPVVIETVRWLDSYTEWSPSRTGVHTIVRAVKGTGRCRTASTPWGGVFEAYDRDRYFTFTGERLDAAPATIEDRQGKTERLLARLFGDQTEIPEPSRNGHGPPRKVPDLLEQHERLRQIVKRTCAPPADPSDSGWDYYLACEARRCGATDKEIEELIGVSRGHDPKSRRPDYLRKTIGAAHRAEPEPGSAASSGTKPRAAGGSGPPWGSSKQEIGSWITDQWNGPADDPIVDGWAFGSSLDGSIVYLQTLSGAEFQFPRLAGLFALDTHLRWASVATGWPVPPLKKPEALLIAQAITALCEVRADPEAGRDEVEEWIAGMVGKASGTRPLDPRNPGVGRWRLLHLVRHGQDPHAEKMFEASLVVAEDPSGERWLPAGQFMDYVRSERRATIGWDELESRMADLGFERREIQQREPGGGRAGEKLSGVFYVGQERWPEEDAA
jgi:hypothetical protein